MRSAEFDSSNKETSTAPLSSGKFSGLGNSLCSCCSSRANKPKPVELTKAETITVQPSPSKSRICSTNQVTSRNDGTLPDDADANTVITTVATSPETPVANLSPQTSKRLKDDCSNVTTVVLDDLIEASSNFYETGHSKGPLNEHMNESEAPQKPEQLNVETLEKNSEFGNNSARSTSSVCSAQFGIHQLNAQKYEESTVLKTHKENDDEEDMEDITDILLETTFPSKITSQNTSYDLYPGKPPRFVSEIQDTITNKELTKLSTNNYKLPHMSTKWAISGIDSSENESDTDEEELTSDRQKYSRNANMGLNSMMKNDEHVKPPSITIQQSSTRLGNTPPYDRSEFSTAVINNDPNNKAETPHYDAQRENIGENCKVNANNNEIMKTSTKQPSLQRPTRMYASSSSTSSSSSSSLSIDNDHNEGDKYEHSMQQENKNADLLNAAVDKNDPDDDDDDEDNITRISLKSHGDATVKSTTLNGEIVRVKLNTTTTTTNTNVESRKIESDEVFTDDEFNERII